MKTRYSSDERLSPLKRVLTFLSLAWWVSFVVAGATSMLLVLSIAGLPLGLMLLSDKSIDSNERYEYSVDGSSELY